MKERELKVNPMNQVATASDNENKPNWILKKKNKKDFSSSSTTKKKVSNQSYDSLCGVREPYKKPKNKCSLRTVEHYLPFEEEDEDEDEEML